MGRQSVKLADGPAWGLSRGKSRGSDPPSFMTCDSTLSRGPLLWNGLALRLSWLGELRVDRTLPRRPQRVADRVCPGGLPLRNPSETVLARRIGLITPIDPHRVYDVAIVGAGPAGLAIYTASKGPSLSLVDLNLCLALRFANAAANGPDQISCCPRRTTPSLKLLSEVAGRDLIFDMRAKLRRGRCRYVFEKRHTMIRGSWEFWKVLFLRSPIQLLDLRTILTPEIETLLKVLR